MDKVIAHKIIDDIKAIPLFSHHICSLGTFVNCTDFYIAPISVWEHTIEVMTNDKHNYYTKTLKKFVEDHPELEDAYFVKNGVGCTPFLRFVVKK